MVHTSFHKKDEITNLQSFVDAFPGGFDGGATPPGGSAGQGQSGFGQTQGQGSQQSGGQGQGGSGSQGGGQGEHIEHHTEINKMLQPILKEQMSDSLRTKLNALVKQNLAFKAMVK
ncbi:hypothetical protein LCGC14_2631810 [marine sediment metagenome]|uniref:Uncharacterized protein n=1 Tax=marine sediment metagenome TaxID=412755 RepID=A0A0F9A087_9ZZZZ